MNRKSDLSLTDIDDKDKDLLFKDIKKNMSKIKDGLKSNQNLEQGILNNILED